MAAKMRMAILLADATAPNWYPILAKRVGIEEELKTMNANLKKMEDCMATNAKDGSPFVLGTQTPTMADIHFYAVASRPFFAKGSALHEEIGKNYNWEVLPRLVKLIEAINARPEFKDVLSHVGTHHDYFVIQKDAEAGKRLSWWLPMKYH